MKSGTFFTMLSLILMVISCGQKQDSHPAKYSDGSADTRHWYQQPMRILQTVLREPDAIGYDAASVVEYMKQTHCNVLVVNAGGIIDFFENPLPAANPNRFLQEGDDVLRDIVKACHDEGFKVIARVDFRGVKKEIYDQHPDWFARDHAGNPITLTYTRIPLHIPCYDSYYRNEHALMFISYLFENYNIDGIWHNSIQVDGVCHCDRCQTQHHADTGTGLPVPEKSSAAEMNAYYDWKATRASNHLATIRGKIKEYGEDKAYAAEVFGMYDVSYPIRTGIDLYSVREPFDFLVSVNFLTENRREIEYKNLGYSASIIRFLKALHPEKQAVILFGQNGTSHRYIMEPDVDSRVFLWEAIASGGGLWNCSFTGQHPGVTYDRRNAMLTADAFRFISEYGNAFDGHLPVEEVTIYYSKATRTYFGSDDRHADRFGAFIQGIERMCRDNHLQYGFLPDADLSSEILSKVKVLILPNVACMSDAEVQMISDWVGQGGRLLATFETSIYDEKGNKRDDFALGKLFGCRSTGTVVDTHMDCYQWIDDHNMVMTPKMKDTRMLINSGETLLCEITSESAKMVCSYMPRITNQSPEMAWHPEAEMTTSHPTMLVNTFGKGKVVYFANQPDRMNHLMGHPDFSDLLYGSVRHLLGDQVMVRTNAPASVHIWLSEKDTGGEKGYVVSLVNHTGGPERPLRSLTPVHNVEVTLNLPGNHRWNDSFLRKEGNLKISQKHGKVTLKIDRLDEFVSVALTEGH
jgi:hypothetical protein